MARKKKEQTTNNRFKLKRKSAATTSNDTSSENNNNHRRLSTQHTAFSTSSQHNRVQTTPFAFTQQHEKEPRPIDTKRGKKSLCLDDLSDSEGGGKSGVSTFSPKSNVDWRSVVSGLGQQTLKENNRSKKVDTISVDGSKKGKNIY